MISAAPPNSVIRSDIVSIIIPDKVGQKVCQKSLCEKTREIQKIKTNFRGKK